MTALECPQHQTTACFCADPTLERARELGPQDKILAGQRAIRRLHGPLDNDWALWGNLADLLNGLAATPDLDPARVPEKDWRRFNTAQALADGLLADLASRRVSIADVVAGRLPRDATGVYWTDIRWTECHPHLTDPSWVPDGHNPLGDDEPAGVVLTGPAICDACIVAAADGRGE